MSASVSDVQPVVRIVGGGEADPAEQAAIVEAIAKVLRSREGHRQIPTSAWSLAGRLEGVGMTTIRARSGLTRISVWHRGHMPADDSAAARAASASSAVA